ncbi:hypothetical protein LEP1GSC151_3843 [Leptospira interrogans serovar Grippotyphosa str. LT2186]|uniref:Uncharacterized protein n=2 Tax=Leptospira interrogans TaxID=173 RepID=M3I2F6_LEPIR|nr:hypothetical protein LEP1GSC045_0022 [Leptospira interrogans serovar Pomona str. Kennewicki LC82-25]EKN96552.1 hypothetical protein LEP1GSC014_3814 [Leptospira interrogans serovar Pomona str. Pomona]EKO71436.1 hypothetical protein LEP1GSC069_3935 [Leptospira interrogans serovar Canicola str. Fiocruz LV133]EKR35432.1 hypothetical protein LEP1GSC096_4489 [Leptospira interrogans serovar Hebdomadis str. R499]EKR43514.1 hypothetical protein LEP1GSC097_0256 [Leptospira interrogans serovar Grippoty
MITTRMNENKYYGELDLKVEMWDISQKSQQFRVRRNLLKTSMSW